MAFSDVRVLDFCWVGAGAFVTRILSDLGADVIKVESRAHPDNLRLSGPHVSTAAQLESSGYFASRNTGKRSMALNMGNPEARAIALKLAAHCSLVTNNFRPGVMEKWGLGYEQVREVNPSVIYLSMPMQGTSGPNRDYIGFGSTIAALCGIVQLSGLPGRPPIGTGTHYPDHIPNPGHALVAVLAAIYHRQRTGEGQEIVLAQIESTINLLGGRIMARTAGEPLQTPTGNRKTGSVPRGVYRCAGEDKWCAIDVETDTQWRNLCAALERPDWANDPSLRTAEGRTGREDEIDAALRATTLSYTATDLADLLQRHGIPAAAMRYNADIPDDAQLRWNGFWHDVPHAEMGSVLANVPPFKVVGEPRRAPGPPPLLGEHTAEIARDLLGMDASEIRRLNDEKIFY